MTKQARIILCLCVLLGVATPLQAGFVPYGRIFKATQDERNYISQARDEKLQLQLHKKLILENPSSLANISSYVFLKHAFLVGEVSGLKEQNELIKCAESIESLNGVSYYLPLENDTPKINSNLEIKLMGIFEPDYPSSKLTVKVVQDKIVVMGVLTKSEQQQVVKTIEKNSGTKNILNFMQVPPDADKKKRRIRPLRNIFD